MDINRFTQKSQEAISSAQSQAVRYGHQQVDVEHLLASLLEQDGGLATSIFTKADINVDGFKRRVEQELERMPKVAGPTGVPDQVYNTSL
jgi:ATP-dependent Clp protease ATP-binding subunit ClpB